MARRQFNTISAVDQDVIEQANAIMQVASAQGQLQVSAGMRAATHLYKQKERSTRRMAQLERELGEERKNERNLMEAVDQEVGRPPDAIIQAAYAQDQVQAPAGMSLAIHLYLQKEKSTQRIAQLERELGNESENEKILMEAAEMTLQNAGAGRFYSSLITQEAARIPGVYGGQTVVPQTLSQDTKAPLKVPHVMAADVKSFLSESAGTPPNYARTLDSAISSITFPMATSAAQEQDARRAAAAVRSALVNPFDNSIETVDMNTPTLRTYTQRTPIDNRPSAAKVFPTGELLCGIMQHLSPPDLHNAAKTCQDWSHGVNVLASQLRRALHGGISVSLQMEPIEGYCYVDFTIERSEASERSTTQVGDLPLIHFRRLCSIHVYCSVCGRSGSASRPGRRFLHSTLGMEIEGPSSLSKLHAAAVQVWSLFSMECASCGVSQPIGNVEIGGDALEVDAKALSDLLAQQ